MTMALEGGEWSAARPGRTLPLGKTRYPLYRRLGGPQGRSGQVQKISPPPGFDPRTVQPVVSRTSACIILFTRCNLEVTTCFGRHVVTPKLHLGNKIIDALVVSDSFYLSFINGDSHQSQKFTVLRAEPRIV
jgi:hypothetical protein